MPGREALLLCLFCSIVILLPVLNVPSWYNASQAYRYPYLLALFREQFLAGYWYPRWLPGLMGGYGYPTFVFYPPGFWFLALPVSFITGLNLFAIKFTLLLMMTVGGLGAYRLARCFCNSGSAMLATLAFYLTPEIAHLIYDTGDFAELLALMLCPWVLYHLMTLTHHIKHGRPCLASAIWLGVTLACVVYAHAIVTIWLSLALILCTLGCAYDNRYPRKTLAITALSALLAMALSSPYWFPALQLNQHIDYGTSLYVFSIQSMRFGELFAFTSDRFGLILPVLAAIGLYYGRHSKLTIAVAIGSALYIWYMLPASLGFRDYFTVLRYLQDPQRVLPVLASFQLVGIALLLGYTERRWSWPAIKHAGIFVIGLLLLASSDHYNIRGFMNYTAYYNSRPWEFEDMTNTREFRPKRASTAKLAPRARHRTPIAVLEGPARGKFTRLERNTDTDVSLEIITEGTMKIRFNQFYFPGWNVTVNDQPVQPCPKVSNAPYIACIGKHGLIDVFIRDAGTHHLHVWYDGVPYAHWRNLVAAIAALLAIRGLRRLCRAQVISA